APLMLEKSDFSGIVCRELGIEAPPPALDDWADMVEKNRSCSDSVRIALVGKYTGLHDAYLSVLEAFKHAGCANNVNVEIKWVDSEKLTPDDLDAELGDVNGIIVPGGFGDRGIEGMILAAGYARTRNIPYLGLCLGMQIAVIEYARNMLGLTDANSGEFDEQCAHKVIDFIPGQSEHIDKGGTLRLGAYPCVIKEGTKMAECYGVTQISERHRHRYEFNNDYRQRFEAAGLTLSGQSPDGSLVETVEISDKPFFIGVQFHPEFKSRPDRPHPLFMGLVAAAKNRKQEGDR
ncbi:MAG: CTP synthase, partial [Firmicutes bacterium]|nr:CTP synthase [Bacillota bacterium]